MTDTPQTAAEHCPLCGSTPGAASGDTWRRWLGAELTRRLGMFELPPELRLSIVVPVYNECHTVRKLVERIQAVPIPKEIILVDDGSTDGSSPILAELATRPDVRLLTHPRNRGKGAALRTAFAHVTGDIVIIQDADLEYDPAQYPQLIQPIVEGVADVVFGSRFLGGGPHRVLYFWHFVGNRLLTGLSNMVTDLNLSDMETCYKTFRRDVLSAIGPTLREERFGIEPELTAKVARRRYRVYEIGVTYFGRTYGEGKKIGLRDAVHAFWCILRYGLWD